MVDTEKKTKKPTVSKGGSKGGTRFPRLNLKEALGYAKKLVSKTFNGPQPETTVFVGVFNNKGPDGGVRASALKQYGLMDGDAKGYFASGLAKKIEAVIPEEKVEPIRKAFLSPKVFKQMYDTLQPDRVTRAKVRQAAATGGVHPESQDICVDCFIEGAAYAGFGTKTEDGIDLGQSSAAPPPPPDDVDAETGDETTNGGSQVGADAVAPLAEGALTAGPDGGDAAEQQKANSPRMSKPTITLSLTVDATSDPEKLQRQLKLLRQFGVI